MATLAPTAPAETTTDGAAVAPAGPVRLMALGLWGVVGSLLTYGIAMTVIKASALFAG